MTEKIDPIGGLREIDEETAGHIRGCAKAVAIQAAKLQRAAAEQDFVQMEDACNKVIATAEICKIGAQFELGTADPVAILAILLAD